MPTIRVQSLVHNWKPPTPFIVQNHLYRVTGDGWTPGTMVFVTFEYLRRKVEEPASQAGPSAMADTRGSVLCWWVDQGQILVPGDEGDENRIVTASTNDGTGRTVVASIQGPVLSTDEETVG
jgi:hypothetical protein